MARVRFAIAAVCAVLDGKHSVAVAPTASPSTTAQVASVSSLPLRFEANVGQWDSRVRFVGRSGQGALLITDDGVSIPNVGVTFKLAGATPRMPRGESELVTKSNFFLGDDPTRWRTNVANFAEVRVESLPGVDVVWHAGVGGVEYDLEVAAGVDARALVLAIEGAKTMRLDGDGALQITTATGALVEKTPRVIQNGREMRARYQRVDDTHVRFAIDGYEPGQALLIDPVLVYSSYLGGTGSDQGNGIAVDASGNAYLTGVTGSANFPAQGAFQSANAGSNDVFVTKINAAGTAIIYSTYLGGAGADQGNAIAIDSNGNAYITGSTASNNFPTLSPIQAANGGGNDLFVTKLNAAGSALVYSTYLGGANTDQGNAIAVDASGNAYVTGVSISTNFPTLSAYQTTNKTTCAVSGCTNAVVVKVKAAGGLSYSTYLGGTNWDEGHGIAVDASGNAYVCGWATSNNFPLQNAFQSYAGFTDAFVTKLGTTGNTLVYSTFVGGGSADEALAIAIDTTGNAYITGTTSSNDYPVVGGVQSVKKTSFNTVFVSELNAAATALVYSTYLGGTGKDSGYGLAVDSSGSAYVAGSTSSSTFPTQNPFQSSNAGKDDAFVGKLSPSGSTLVYSTYLGGSASDDAYAIAIDGTGAAYVVGGTSSTDFMTQAPLQTKNQGTSNAFVSKIDIPDLALGAACTPGACASAHCVDGICCSSACTDRCEACDVQGNLGTCVPVAGVPHSSHAPCDDAGTTGACAPLCDGTNTKTCAYPGTTTVCASVCKESAETDTLCDGTGRCGGLGRFVVHSCDGLTCTADNVACKASCAAETDCASGYTCADGGCVIGTTCIDDHTSQTPYGSAEDCTPYQCAGGCKKSCTSIDDCAAPNVCGVDGKCGAATAPSTQSGCGCRVTSNGTSSPFALLGLGITALVARRRRRST